MKNTLITAALTAVVALTMTACTDDEPVCPQNTTEDPSVVNALSLPDLAGGRGGTTGGRGGGSVSGGSTGGSTGGLTKNNTTGGSASSGGTAVSGGSTGGTQKGSGRTKPPKRFDDDVFEDGGADGSVNNCG